MHIHTIEAEYEYRIVAIVRQLVKDYKLEFENGEQMMDWLHQNSLDFGRLIVDDMSQWKDENEWLKEIDD